MTLNFLFYFYFFVNIDYLFKRVKDIKKLNITYILLKNH
jgi:hypothetical protein